LKLKAANKLKRRPKTLCFLISGLLHLPKLSKKKFTDLKFLKLQTATTNLWVIPCEVIQQNGNFSSDPHHNSRNFIRGKISGFWAQQSWNFWNRTWISKIM